MKLQYIQIGILLFSLLIPRTSSQIFSEGEKKILEMQDSRQGALLREADYSSATLAKRLLNAYANIADSNECRQIFNINEAWDADISVKEMAAFALGQIQSLESIRYLRLMLQRESDNFGLGRSRLVSEIINSLGKTGNENDLKTICAIKTESDSIRGAIALAIARLGMRKITSSEAADKLKSLTYYIEDENQRKWVAYAYNRIANKEMIVNARNELEFLSASQNPFCKMWAIAALGKTGDPSYTEFTMKWYAIQTDWRVKVNMLSAVAGLEPDDLNLTEETFTMLMHSAVDDANPNVSITACQTLAKVCAKLGIAHRYTLKLREYFEHYLAPGRAIDDFVQNELIKTLAKIFKDEYKKSLFSLFAQAEGYDRKSSIVSSFQYLENPSVYKELRDAISSDVQQYNKTHPNKDGSMIGSPELAKMYLAFVQVLSALDDKMGDKDRNIVRLIYSEFSASKDPAITDVCLSSLTDTMYSKYWQETGQVMVFDFAGFNETRDKDVMLMYIEAWGKMKSESAEEILLEKVKSFDYDIAKASSDALLKIKGEDYTIRITAPKFRNDFDWSFINKLYFKDNALIVTEKGTIQIELFPEIAPFTVQSFVKLGEKGFYNGTIFHRVVPNFVIQGGDPTGTGYGGPGYSIRTEIADIGFDSYYVGMASSGKDTEGSQFFITHSPQPHLDGKYTIFGKVTDGFDVVDKFVIGDKILTITFSSN